MSKKLKIKYVLFLILISLPVTSLANSATTRIGISVKIKAKQECGFTYTVEKDITKDRAEHTRLYDCGIKAINLQQKANLVATLVFKISKTENNNNRLRVFKTVQ